MRFSPLSNVALTAGTSFKRPSEPPSIVHLDDPAADVMTDFEEVNPVTVRPDVPIDRALGRMKAAGVRLLLVTDKADRIIGLITATDIEGEKPVDLVQETRTRRANILVEMIMTPQPDIIALDMEDVNRFRVGHIVETLQKLRRQHILVVEALEDAPDKHQVCGLFSMSQINKQLGQDASGVAPEHISSLAERAHHNAT